MRIALVALCLLASTSAFADDYLQVDGEDIAATPDRWRGKKIEARVSATYHTEGDVRFVLRSDLPVTIFAEPSALSSEHDELLRRDCNTVKKAINGPCKGIVRFEIVGCKNEDAFSRRGHARAVCIAEKALLVSEPAKTTRRRR